MCRNVYASTVRDVGAAVVAAYEPVPVNVAVREWKTTMRASIFECHGTAV